MRRRAFLTPAIGGSAALALPPSASAAAAPGGLKSITAGAKPLSVEERRERIARLQRLMVDRKVGALIMESGSSLDYFTGVQWRRSERTTAAVIPARGEIV